MNLSIPNMKSDLYLKREWTTYLLLYDIFEMIDYLPIIYSILQSIRNMALHFYASFIVTYSKVPLIVILLILQEYHY